MFLCGVSCAMRAASLSENGCTAITVVNSPHYDGIFAMREAARWGAFQGTAFIPFTCMIIQAIVMATREDDGGSAVSVKDACQTYVFSQPA